MSTTDTQSTATRPTAPSETDRALEELRRGAADLATLSLDERIALAESCLEGIGAVARRWVEAACAAKRLPEGSSYRAEEVTAGPMSGLRYLQLILASLRDIRRSGRPRLPGRPYIAADGRCRVPVFPTGRLFDSILFKPIRAECRMLPGVDPATGLFGDHVRRLTNAAPESARVTLVLGAGNVSAIPLTDSLTKVFQENRTVLLKMCPVNDYLGPIFAEALQPLVDRGYLRIVYGGADVGGYAVNHDSVEEIHVTGSVDTHDAIVWGGDADERARRRAADNPAVKKPVTSELSNVSPWLVVPGGYSDKQLRFQAEHVASSIVNNASFNCVSTKMIITWKRWSDRGRFLDRVEDVLRRAPRRHAYYPGALERYREFSGREPDPVDSSDLPWTLLRDVDPERSPHLFERESFVCVCGEIGLDGETPEEFLARAVDFMNDRLWGTLSASLSVPRGFSGEKRAALDTALARLRYGAIGINLWPAVGYSLMSPPWGGYPGTDAHDVQSGVGMVHNTYLLEGTEKTVLTAPLTLAPRPLWFPGHRNAEPLAWKLVDLYRRPSWVRLLPVVFHALKG